MFSNCSCFFLLRFLIFQIFKFSIFDVFMLFPFVSNSFRKTIRFEIPDDKTSIFLQENYTLWDPRRRNVNTPKRVLHLLRQQMSKCQHSYRKAILCETPDVELSIFLKENYTCWDPRHRDANIAKGILYLLR